MTTPVPDLTPSAPPAPDPLHISARTATILLVFTLVFTALMAQMYQITRPVIEATAQDAKRRLIGEVLPAEDYDNDLLADAINLPPIAAIGLTEATQLYRARKNGQTAALVFETAALDGYSGEIRLIMAVRADGRLAAVRVILHKETPGLGDYIDPRKDKNKKSPWISQFDQRGFVEVPRERWRVKKDGGVFDQRAGATISARAITNATGRALVWVQERTEMLYSLPAEARFEEKPQ